MEENGLTNGEADRPVFLRSQGREAELNLLEKRIQDKLQDKGYDHGRFQEIMFSGNSSQDEKDSARKMFAPQLSALNSIRKLRGRIAKDGISYRAPGEEVLSTVEIDGGKDVDLSSNVVSNDGGGINGGQDMAEFYSELERESIQKERNGNGRISKRKVGLIGVLAGAVLGAGIATVVSPWVGPYVGEKSREIYEDWEIHRTGDIRVQKADLSNKISFYAGPIPADFLNDPEEGIFYHSGLPEDLVGLFEEISNFQSVPLELREMIENTVIKKINIRAQNGFYSGLVQYSSTDKNLNIQYSLANRDNESDGSNLNITISLDSTPTILMIAEDPDESSPGRTRISQWRSDSYSPDDLLNAFELVRQKYWAEIK